VHELARHDDAPSIEPFMLPEWIALDPTPPPSSETTPRPAVPSAEEFAAQYEHLQGSVRALARHYRRDRRQIYRWIAAHGLSDPTYIPPQNA
jgi:hypothetical protein